jgi:hypothetical protein
MKRFLSVLTMVLAVIVLGAGVAFAELEMYDANGQFIGVADYYVLGGNGHVAFIPALGVSVFLDDLLESGEMGFSSHILIDADDGAWGRARFLAFGHNLWRNAFGPRRSSGPSVGNPENNQKYRQ